jgi:electron transport complex protein RnfD
MENSTTKNNVTMFLALSSIILMSCYYYGMKSLTLILYSVLFAFLIERITMLFYGIKKFKKGDLSFIFTGITIALLCPSTIPLWIVFVANIVAIFIAKFPFGGSENYIFNPTAVGVCFIAISFSDVFFMYPAKFTPFAFVSDKAQELVSSPGLIMLKGGTPKISIADTFLGNFPGAIGTTCVLVLFACLAFLIYNKTIAWETPAFCIGSLSVVASFFPRLTTQIYISSLFEIAVGSLLIGVIFLATDKQSSPKTYKGRAIFGIFLGVVTMLFRYFGKIEESFLFVLLIANALSNSFDKLGEFLTVDFTSRIKLFIPKSEVKTDA